MNFILQHRLTGQYRQANAAGAEAKLRYQETALNAFREVADALVSRQKLDQACGEQAEAIVQLYKALGGGWSLPDSAGGQSPVRQQ
jgi:outer membrane protein TolC